MGAERCHMRRTRATYLICASLGRGIGKKKGEKGKKKKKASLCITHVHGSARCSRLWPQPLAGATIAVYSQEGLPRTGCPSCRTPHGSVHPSCSRSRRHGTPNARTGQSHEGFEPTRGTRAPAPHIAAGRVRGCWGTASHAGPVPPVRTAPSRKNFPSGWKAVPHSPWGPAGRQGAAAGTLTSLFFFPSWASCKWAASLASRWLCPVLALNSPTGSCTGMGKCWA